jgi:hypothetical protein
MSCATVGGDDHGHLHKKLKASTIVDNDKIEKQVSDIDETSATKVNTNNNNCKKSLLFRFKVKDNKVVQDNWKFCSFLFAIEDILLCSMESVRLFVSQFNSSAQWNQ